MAASFSGAVLCRLAVAALIVSTLASYAEARPDCYAPCNDCPNCGGWCKQKGYPKGGHCLPKDGGGVVFCCCDRTDAVRKLLVPEDALH